ncbi:hypothetical protein BGW80DRAFT_1459515 [Lactifluus volemus]|nr:hypothetical protein BGW80DRAFT_1459515 [Lactifluus volemus]
MTFESATPELHTTEENIVIKQRRKRLLVPEPPVEESCMRALLNTIVPFPDFPSADADTGEGTSPRGLFTFEEKAGEGRPVTVHEFLQDMTSKSVRKYGRRNRLGTVKLDVGRSEDSSSPTDLLRVVSLPKIHVTIVSLLFPHTTRTCFPTDRTPSSAQKASCKAPFSTTRDVFTPHWHAPRSRAYTHSAAVAVRHLIELDSVLGKSPDPRATPVDGARRGTVTPAEMLAVSIAPVTSPNAASGEPPSLNRAVTTQRARPLAGSSGAVLASRRKVFRAHGGKQSLARSPPGPFQYARLPLVQVKIHQGAMLP